MQVDRKQFAAALRRVAPAVATRGQIPAYSGVHIHALSKLTGLGLEAANGDMAISTMEYATDADGGLDVVVPHAVLSGFVGAVTGDVTLTLDGNDLVARSGGAEIRLRTLPLEDFPPFPTVGEAVEVGNDVINAMRHVSYAASRDQARPILTCVHAEAGWVVATDSYRLAAHRVDISEADFLVPASALASAKNTDGVSWDLRADSRRVALSDAMTTVVVRQIEGQFPSWQRLIPETCAFSIEVNREHMLDALKRSAVMRAGDQPVVMKADGAGLARLEMSARDVGDFSEVLDSKGPAEFPAIGFRPAFMAEALESFAGETVTLQFDGAHKPIKLAEGDMVALVMPVRI